jgi:hypothetical protein
MEYIIAIEKLLKDIYGFYKLSPKRRNALLEGAKASVAQARNRMDKALDDLVQVMDETITKGIMRITVMLIVRRENIETTLLKVEKMECYTVARTSCLFDGIV